MATELSKGKTMVILAVMAGCFAILFPKIFYPMFQQPPQHPASSTEQHHVPPPLRERDTSGGRKVPQHLCCGVVFESDASSAAFLTELCSLVLMRHHDPHLSVELLAEGVHMHDAGSAGSSGGIAFQQCRMELLDKCGIDLDKDIIKSDVDGAVKADQRQLRSQFGGKVRERNLTSCLQHHFDIDENLVRAKKSYHPPSEVYYPRHMRPERPPHLMHPDAHMHPALREKGRVIPPPSRTIEKQAKPGPMPGMRPPMGGGGHIMSPPPGSGGMGILMPIYTIGIVCFFLYTIMKIAFKKPAEESNHEPRIKDFHLDPEHRKFLFAEEYCTGVSGVLPEMSVHDYAALMQQAAELHQQQKQEQLRRSRSKTPPEASANKNEDLLEPIQEHVCSSSTAPTHQEEEPARPAADEAVATSSEQPDSTTANTSGRLTPHSGQDSTIPRDTCGDEDALMKEDEQTIRLAFAALKAQKEEEVDQLRRRLEETERAMERICRQMGSVADRLSPTAVAQLLTPNLDKTVLAPKEEEEVMEESTEKVAVDEQKPESAAEKDSFATDEYQRWLQLTESHQAEQSDPETVGQSDNQADVIHSSAGDATVEEETAADKEPEQAERVVQTVSEAKPEEISVAEADSYATEEYQRWLKLTQAHQVEQPEMEAVVESVEEMERIQPSVEESVIEEQLERLECAQPCGAEEGPKEESMADQEPQQLESAVQGAPDTKSEETPAAEVDSYATEEYQRWLKLTQPQEVEQPEIEAVVESVKELEQTRPSAEEFVVEEQVEPSECVQETDLTRSSNEEDGQKEESVADQEPQQLESAVQSPPEEKSGETPSEEVDSYATEEYQRWLKLTQPQQAEQAEVEAVVESVKESETEQGQSFVDESVVEKPVEQSECVQETETNPTQSSGEKEELNEESVAVQQSTPVTKSEETPAEEEDSYATEEYRRWLELTQSHPPEVEAAVQSEKEAEAEPTKPSAEADGPVVEIQPEVQSEDAAVKAAEEDSFATEEYQRWLKLTQPPQPEQPEAEAAGTQVGMEQTQPSVDEPIVETQPEQPECVVQTPPDVKCEKTPAEEEDSYATEEYQRWLKLTQPQQVEQPEVVSGMESGSKVEEIPAEASQSGEEPFKDESSAETVQVEAAEKPSEMKESALDSEAVEHHHDAHQEQHLDHQADVGKLKKAEEEPVVCEVNRQAEEVESGIQSVCLDQESEPKKEGPEAFEVEVEQCKHLDLEPVPVEQVVHREVCGSEQHTESSADGEQCKQEGQQQSEPEGSIEAAVEQSSNAECGRNEQQPGLEGEATVSSVIQLESSSGEVGQQQVKEESIAASVQETPSSAQEDGESSQVHPTEEVPVIAQQSAEEVPRVEQTVEAESVLLDEKASHPEVEETVESTQVATEEAKPIRTEQETCQAPTDPQPIQSSVLEEVAESVITESVPQEKPSASDDHRRPPVTESGIQRQRTPSEERKLTVMGFDSVAAMEDCRKMPPKLLPRVAETTKPHAPSRAEFHMDPEQPITSVLLDTYIPPESHLVVSEAECSAVPIHDLEEMEPEDEYEASPVVLSGKMVLSVIGMEPIPAEGESHHTPECAPRVTFPPEPYDKKIFLIPSVDPEEEEELVVEEEPQVIRTEEEDEAGDDSSVPYRPPTPPLKHSRDEPDAQQADEFLTYEQLVEAGEGVGEAIGEKLDEALDGMVQSILEESIAGSIRHPLHVLTDIEYNIVGSSGIDGEQDFERNREDEEMEHSLEQRDQQADEEVEEEPAISEFTIREDYPEDEELGQSLTEEEIQRARQEIDEIKKLLAEVSSGRIYLQQPEEPVDEPAHAKGGRLSSVGASGGVTSASKGSSPDMEEYEVIPQSSVRQQQGEDLS